MSKSLPADPLLQSYSSLSSVPGSTPSPCNRCLQMLVRTRKCPRENSPALSGNSYPQMLNV